MAARKSTGSSDVPEKKTAAKQEKAWSKPRITRHGNMRQITQMS